ncbi:hypothetical protein ACUV84_010013 [Puccinellia chinampoensis]
MRYKTDENTKTNRIGTKDYLLCLAPEQTTLIEQDLERMCRSSPFKQEPDGMLRPPTFEQKPERIRPPTFEQEPERMRPPKPFE